MFPTSGLVTEPTILSAKGGLKVQAQPWPAILQLKWKSEKSSENMPHVCEDLGLILSTGKQSYVFWIKQ